MDAILNFDWAIFQAVEKLWSPVMDMIMKVITLSGDAGAIWIVLGLALLINKKTRKYGAVVICALLFSLLINDMILKNAFSRPRPYLFEGWPGQFIYPDIVHRETSFSFPSGHTSSSFAAAAALWFSRKKWLIIPTTIWAALIGFSRIYVHVHYTTDVLGGIVVGILYAVMAWFLINAVIKLWEKRKAKKAAA